MLRIQRSVETANSQVNYMAQEMMFAAAKGNEKAEVVGAGIAGVEKISEQQALSQNESNKRKFVASSSVEPPSKVTRPAETSESNPEEINIDEDGESEDVAVKTKPIPSAVFGSVAQAAEEQKEEGGKKLGALERFSTGAN